MLPIIISSSIGTAGHKGVPSSSLCCSTSTGIPATAVIVSTVTASPHHLNTRGSPCLHPARCCVRSAALRWCNLGRRRGVGARRLLVEQVAGVLSAAGTRHLLAVVALQPYHAIVV